MRFMMIVKASKDSESGIMPSEQLLAGMTQFNEELVKAGVLVDLSGLQPSSKGARVKFSAGKPTVIDGPFAETRDLIAGYWIINVRSKEEAIEWAKRVPSDPGSPAPKVKSRSASFSSWTILHLPKPSTEPANWERNSPERGLSH
jgi:hypothetical protein